MSARKSERLLNLLIMLLVQRRPVPKQRIRAALYPETTADAFDKMFERDKDELRQLGVPIEVSSADVLFDEPGYQVRSDDFLLPDLGLEADEAAILAVAGQVWQNARLAADARSGLQKLSALGVDLAAPGPEQGLPQLAAEEPAFELFWDATQQRVPVRFSYRRPEGPERERTVEPWGVLRSSGRWYLVGHDRDRNAQRTFRLSRVTSPPVAADRPGSYTVPEGLDLRAVADRLSPAPPDLTVEVLLRPGRGHQIRRRALEVTEGVPGPGQDQWDLARVVAHRERVVDEVLQLGPDAVVTGPQEVRDEVVRRLHAQAALLGAGHPGVDAGEAR